MNTYWIGNIHEIESNARHKTANVPRAVLDTRVQKGKEGQLYQLSRADGHCSCVFRSNPELDSVKKGQVLQERSAFGQHLASILAFPPIVTRVSVSSV